ncbi:hypothetical protein [Roseiconus lacunae]|uniref:Nuclear transport factor 2 family protein n=1 Tax=Roseiconus lacunae TaxID=2605694 RepID=A0ABT7PT74_9BACT|nr:hypothetical protein [Roseiconus lacunae]MDM4019568.1 hypothetical protein [Roseiconus lacunae]
MITPLKGKRLRTERPYPPQSPLKRLGSWLRGDSKKSNDELERELLALLEHVQKCQQREELNDLVGDPDYVMAGTLFASEGADGKTVTPDLVECYSRSRLTIELWFRDGVIMKSIGYVMPNFT